MTDAYDEVISRLEGIQEDLTDRGMSRLREAIESGEPNGGQEEKQIAKARRAVEKAIRDLQAI